MYTITANTLRHDEFKVDKTFNKKYAENEKGIEAFKNDMKKFAIDNNLPVESVNILINELKKLEINDYRCTILGRTHFTLKRTTTKSNLPSINNIVENVKNAKSSKTEWHSRIYEDNCWCADIEVHPYGLVRFWVGFEDKRSGDCRGSLVTLYYLNNQGELRYCTDGIQIKKVVWDKIQRVAKALIKENLLTLQ